MTPAHVETKFSYENGLEIAKLVMPVISPFVQGLLWYGFTRMDKRADALNNLIAFAEIIPAVDLNLPKGVVLAALYDKTGDAMALINDLVQGLKDIPAAVKEKVKDIEEDIKDILPDVPEPIIETVEATQATLTALADCNNNARKELGIFYNVFTAVPWIASCMTQKGFPVTTKWIKEHLGL